MTVPDGDTTTYVCPDCLEAITLAVARHVRNMRYSAERAVAELISSPASKILPVDGPDKIRSDLAEVRRLADQIEQAPDGGTPAARDAIARCLADVEDFPESEHYALADDVLLALRNAGFRIIGRDHTMTVPDGDTTTYVCPDCLCTRDTYCDDDQCECHGPQITGNGDDDD